MTRENGLVIVVGPNGGVIDAVVAAMIPLTVVSMTRHMSAMEPRSLRFATVA